MKHFRLHREGKTIIITTLLVLTAIVAVLMLTVFGSPLASTITIVVAAFCLGFVLYFFRDPRRTVEINDNVIIAPADGKIVVIEEVDENEYFKDKRLQVSIFMSPANVHVNRTPISGQVTYAKYHPGKYLVAWHPKSSTDNERNTIVIGNQKLEILVRQIAGAMARRIVSYLDEGDDVVQGNELGFIKFGSRVDLFLPIDTKIEVNLKEKVKGGKTIIGYLS